MSTPTIPALWSDLSTPNPEFLFLLKTLPENYTLVTPETTISSLRAYNRGASPKWAGVEERDETIVMRDGFGNRARVYYSADSDERGEKRPLVVMVHGGGFCAGNLETEERSCRVWAQKFGVVVLSISYRLAPENPFPQGILDVFDGVKWAASNFETLGADPAKGFILAGVSAGATCIAVVSHLYRDEALSPPLTGLYLSLVVPCVASALPEPYSNDARIVSWEQNAEAPLFNRKAFQLFSELYNAPADHPYRSPLLFPTGHRGLPPSYFLIAGADPTRDYALLYEEVLRIGGGVKTKTDIFPGLPHGFWNFFPDATFSVEQREKSDEGLKWLLEEEGSQEGK